MRQHVNPLSRFFQEALDLPETKFLFEDDTLPIHIDIGCARGKFLIDLASKNSDWNYLGVEIRNKLVLSAQKDKTNLGFENLQFLYCNANVSVGSWLEKLRNGQLQRVSIQFPDPWFKRRHFKRRVLQPSLLISIAKSFSTDSELFIQSDVISVLQPMIDLIDASKCFVREKISNDIWLNENPFLAMTEREIYVKNIGSPIYRALYKRNANSVPNLSDLESIYRDYFIENQ